jgi:hypothetical protein
VLIGAWYLVRGYRINQKLKLAREEAPTTGTAGGSGPARASRRYTPPTSPSGKPKSRRGDERRAG